MRPASHGANQWHWSGSFRLSTRCPACTCPCCSTLFSCSRGAAWPVASCACCVGLLDRLGRIDLHLFACCWSDFRGERKGGRRGAARISDVHTGRSTLGSA